MLGADSRAVFDGNSVQPATAEKVNASTSAGTQFFVNDDRDKGCKPKPGKGKGRGPHCPISDSDDMGDED